MSAQQFLSAQQFQAIIAAGILPDDRVELVGGILINRAWRDQRHTHAMTSLCGQLRPTLPVRKLLRCFEPIQLGSCTRPVPDIVIAHGTPARYRDRAPHAKDIDLIIEVVDRSYDYARGEKWRRYASSKIPIYWIVNLAERRVEIYQRPSGGATGAHYLLTRVVSENEVLPIAIDGVAIGEIPIRKLLLEGGS